MSSIYIVATPIGNLKDITLRSLEILKKVDLILCEDTRTSKKLLASYGIKTPVMSYHQHSQLNKIEFILNALKQGKNLALVSDAGTPGISDPGNELIDKIIKEDTTRIVKISPIPGVSALSAAASICGFPMDRFTFMGFPPAKKKRQKFFEQIAVSKYPVIFYESPYRILKTLEQLGTVINDNSKENNPDSSYSQAFTQIVVCRELTKKFETIYRGDINEVIKELKQKKPKGEFAVVVRR
jgi:16S rRNA (cytidine1402-2'-O)-methyltransferase